MNFYSIAAAMLAVACTSIAVSALSRRFGAAHREIGFVWAIAISVSIGVPVLMSSSVQDMARVVQPREAIDWMPIAMIVLASVATVASIQPRLATVVMIAGLVVCIAWAARMLYGGIYFRSGTLSWTSVAWSTAWGGLMASCWLVSRTNDSASSDLAHYEQIEAPELNTKQHVGWASWLEIATWLVAIASIALSLAMSGSIVYGLAAGLLWIATLCAALGAGRFTTFVSLPAIALIGLGIAYAELSFMVGAFLVTSLLIRSSASRLSNVRVHMAASVVTIAIAASAVGVVASKFAADSTKTDDGYGAYK